MLKFFEIEARFPRHASEFPPAAVAYVARTRRNTRPRLLERRRLNRKQHVADPVRDVLLPTPAAVRPGQGPTRSGVRSVPARPVLPGLSRSRPRAHRPVPPERRPAGERAPHARLPRG